MAQQAFGNFVLASIVLDVATSFAIAPLDLLPVSEVLLLTQLQPKELSTVIKNREYHLLSIMHADHSSLPEVTLIVQHKDAGLLDRSADSFGCQLFHSGIEGEDSVNEALVQVIEVDKVKTSGVRPRSSQKPSTGTEAQRKNQESRKEEKDQKMTVGGLSLQGTHYEM